MIHMAEQMTHRERIMAAIRHQPLDRVPTDYWGVDEITEKLRTHFGAKSNFELYQKMDLDKVMNVFPKFLPTDRAGEWNIKSRPITLPGGGLYYEPLGFPIENCESIAEIEATYTFPSVDMYDYSVIPEQIKAAKGYAIEGGYISLSYFYSEIRGVEQMLTDLLAEPEIARYIISRLQDFLFEHVKRILEAGDGKIDICQVTDDFGSQGSLLMSPEMIEEFFGEQYRKNIQMVKSYGAAVFHHDDGAMSALVPWLAEQGIEMLNPLQWHLPGWDLKALKRDFGGQICFHGGVDNQYVLPFGTQEEVRREVRDCMDALFSDGTGYILAPCHNVQSNTSVENVLAMYDEARRYRP